MTTMSREPRARLLLPLENGDHLDQPTFHARYEGMPEDCRAELVGGIVYMASPRKLPHSKAQQLASRWLGEYAEATPGTDALLNNSQILGPDSEPEPDGCLFIASEYGGQVYVDENDNLNGSPELIVEVSSSTESIDLNRKKLDYQKAGVREYVVLARQPVGGHRRGRQPLRVLGADRVWAFHACGAKVAAFRVCEGPVSVQMAVLLHASRSERRRQAASPAQAHQLGPIRGRTSRTVSSRLTLKTS